MKSFLSYVLFIVAFFSSASTSAQLNVVPNQTANQLVDRLVGTGVVYSNPVLTCSSDASGKFDNGLTTSISMDSGIVLTTGTSNTTYLFGSPLDIGVNLSAAYFASTDNLFYTTDVDLSAAATGTTYDMCKLEFDFVPIGDTIEFNYRFGSEEYTTYSCSNFNDIFAFFISGPGYAVPTNVALIPGTFCPVSINTINYKTNNPCGNVQAPCAPPFNSLYVDNILSPTISYDGLTVKLKAQAPVTPCSTYHMKFAIADVFDGILDSGVFLEAGSFVSEAATVSAISSTNNLGGSTPFTIEGCQSSVVTIKRPNPKPTPQLVALTYSGTATPGIDYTGFPATVTIPANDTVVSFTITALTDALAEGMETIDIQVFGSACNTTATDQRTIEIYDIPGFNVTDNFSICQGQSASLSAISNPSNSFLTFSWSGGTIPTSGSNVSVTPGTTTTYTVSASYPGCSNQDSLITVAVEPTPTISLSPQDITCLNPAGSITATGTAGSAFTFTISPGGNILSGSPSTFTGLGGGTYSVTISSVAGCSNTATATINTTAGLNWNNTNFVNNVCNGGAIGSINATVFGGTAPISYTLNPGAITNTTGLFNGLLAATYTVQAVDFIGCSATTIVTINEPSALIWNSVTTNPVLCNGQSNGSIVIAATGGSGGYTYTLNPGSVNNSNGQFNTLNAGSYTIQVSDANACSNVTVVNISEPGLLNWSALSSSNVTCNGYADASINATAIGGQGSINYTLQPGNIQNSTGIYNGLNAGIYTVTATDQNACSISTVTTLTEPNALNFTVVQNTIPSCVPGNDASINVSVSGGTPNYTYTIGSGNQGNGNFLNLGAGNYIVVASDNNACSISTSVNIASPPNVSWSNVTVTNANCFGVADGQISALATTANPVLNYTLNPGNLSGSGNFTSLAANTYTLTATDAIGCSAISLVQINQPTQILFNGVVSNPALCQGSNTGSISLSANGGSGALSYTLLPGSVTNSTGVFNNLSSAAYTVIATDLNGCSNSTIVNVTQPISMQWSSVSPQMVNCFGQNDGSIISTATGGSGLLTYQILPGSVSNTSGTFNNLTAGVYSITATDVNLCFISTTVSISEPLPLQIINVSQTPLSCVPGNDASIIVSVSGGTPTYQYAINGGSLQSSNQFSNLSPGQYTVTATDLNSCTVSTIVVAQAPVVLSWTNATSTPVSCSGSSDGDISVLISNNNGGLQYVLNAGLQQNASGNFSGLTAGLYTVVATDALNCSLATTLLVGSPLPVQVNSFTKTDPSCFGDNNGSAQISASGGTGSFLYQIQPGNITTSSGIFNALGANNYTITATDINGCSVSTLFSLMQPQQLLINAVVTKETGCVPNNTGSISVYAAGGSGALSYSVGGVFGVSPTFNNLIAAPYVVVVKDANGCTVSSATVVNQTPSPGFTFVNHEDLLCHSDNTGSLQAYATGPAQIINYNLQPGNRDTLIPSFVNLPAANYVVTVTDVNGCTSTTNINVLNPEALSFSQFDVIHPNCADAQSGQILSEVVGGTGNIEYTLWPGSQTNSFGDYTLLNPKLYTIVAKDANGCSISRLETLVQENCCDNIFVPNAFSPNNDALNDEFRMVNAYGIDLKKFVVMNRWGNVVFESTNPQIGWNGRHDGELCEVGNYYYLIQYVCPETKKEYLLKGDLMLMR
jgi:gliding motility-associated-like protein